MSTNWSQMVDLFPTRAGPYLFLPWLQGPPLTSIAHLSVHTAPAQLHSGWEANPSPLLAQYLLTSFLLMTSPLCCKDGTFVSYRISRYSTCPLEKGMATHSSILAWRIPWTEEPGELWSIGLQRIGHDWSNLAGKHATCLWALSNLIWKFIRWDILLRKYCISTLPSRKQF